MNKLLHIVIFFDLCLIHFCFSQQPVDGPDTLYKQALECEHGGCAVSCDINFNIRIEKVELITDDLFLELPYCACISKPDIEFYQYPITVARIYLNKQQEKKIKEIAELIIQKYPDNSVSKDIYRDLTELSRHLKNNEVKKYLEILKNLKSEWTLLPHSSVH